MAVTFLCKAGGIVRLRGVSGLLGQRRNMPVCTVDTNLKPVDIPDGFTQDLVKHVADILNKPLNLVTVTVNDSVDMCRGADRSPTALVQIWSVGVFDAERNPTYSKKLFDFLMPRLNVSADQLAVLLHPIEKKDAAHLLYADMAK